MSRGLHCFVSASVLFTFDPVKLSDVAAWPGRPERRISVIDGKTVPVTSFPAANLFLQTLKALCDRLVVVAPWDPNRTDSLLRNFGWNSFDETRTIYSVPGQDTFTLASVGCSLDKFSDCIVVTETKTAWDQMLHAQIIEACHEKDTPQSSFTLLKVLSAFIQISEARVRFPQTAVASCATLCRTGLFVHCRFFLSPELEEPWLVAMMITEHGGYIVLSLDDATHHIVNDEFTLMKTNAAIDNIPSDQRDKMNVINGVAKDMEGEEVNIESYADRNEEDEDEESIEEDAFFYDVRIETQQNKPLGVCGKGANAGETYWGGNNNIDEEDEDSPNGFSREAKDFNKGAPITVTMRWIRDCCEGLQLYPRQETCASDGDSSLWLTALLCAALLPPPDADPLRLSNFNAIATAHAFPPLAPSQAEDLQQHWPASFRMEADPAADDWLLSRPEKRSLESDTAFSDHLAFVAEQFCDTWESVMRTRRRLGTREAGTQTAVLVTASAAVNTEAAERAAEPTGRALLMRALGPADWAREIGGAAPAAAAGAPLQLRAAERTEANEAGGWGETAAVAAEAETGGETKAKAPAVPVMEGVVNEEGGPEFTKCFISTEGLGERGDGLEKDALLRQLPFRNYPMKIFVEKRGIHCVFASSVDAKRFCRERFAEILETLLPIVPEYDDERSSGSDNRKKRRSRSPPAPIPAGNNFQAKINRREQATVSQKAANEGWELTKSDLDLLNEIGANFEFALQNVHVVEHYVSNELKDPAFRKQKQQLLSVIEKLKRIRKNTV